MKDKGRTFPSKRLLCLLPALLVGCSEPEQTSSEIPLRSVKVAVVDASDNVTVRTFSGTVSSTQETSLSFRVSGTVIEKNVSVSDRVGRGDVLARLDPAPFELEVQRAIASVAEARSNARNASSSYDRTKRLYEAGNSSREDLDNAKTAADSALAQTASAAKALELAQLDLQYTRLVSEGSCAIALTDLQVGENVQQGSRCLSPIAAMGWRLTSVFQNGLSLKLRGAQMSVLVFPLCRTPAMSVWLTTWEFLRRQTEPHFP